MGALSKDGVEFWNAVNAYVVACGGDSGRVSMPRMNAVAKIEATRRAIADEVERLRKDLEIAEQSRDAWMADRERIAGKNELLRAEVLALLDSDSIRTSDYCDGADGDDEPISEECYDETPCQAHRLAALLAKLRGAP